ncbi:hypothetical protein [Rhodococcus sp. USK10]|nr:hypothetical protein [Rhodococcus sp. USK10]
MRWVEPAIVVDVAYRDLTSGGLRHPSYKGTRLDIDPASVRVEDL